MHPESQLTVREMKVVSLIASGLSTKDTARMLGIDFETTVIHRSNAMKKLNATSAASLMRAAIRMGLLER